MRSRAGRALRIIAGGALIAAGIDVAGDAGVTMAAVGGFVVATGAFNACLLAPLFGLDLMGRSRAAS